MDYKILLGKKKKKKYIFNFAPNVIVASTTVSSLLFKLFFKVSSFYCLVFGRWSNLFQVL